MSFNYRFEPPTIFDDDDLYFECPYNHECDGCEYDCGDDL
jgi:hypothetical protein